MLVKDFTYKIVRKRHDTCVICCVVVRILANGLQQTGNVSSNVGLECVSKGFMYLVSKSPQILASNAFSLGFVPPPLLPPPLPPPGNDPSCIELYCEMWTQCIGYPSCMIVILLLLRSSNRYDVYFCRLQKRISLFVTILYCNRVPLISFSLE